MSLVTPWWYRVPPVHPPSSRRGSSTHSTRTGMTFSGWVYIDYLAIFQASASSKLGGSRHPPPPSQVVVHCRILEQTDASLFQAVTLLLSVGYSPAMTPPLPPDPVGQGDQPIHNSRHASWERRSSSVGFPCSWCTKCCFTATYWKYRYLQQCWWWNPPGKENKQVKCKVKIHMVSQNCKLWHCSRRIWRLWGANHSGKLENG